MANNDKNLRHQEDLTDADRAVLRLYEDAKTPIPWDKSDDAVLAFAASIHEPAADSDAEQAPEAEEPTVVPFRRPQGGARPTSVFRSPLAGLAIAASLLIGVVVGQTVLPQFNEDQSRDYAQIIEDNERLAEQLARFGDLQGTEEYFQVLEENAALESEIEDLRRIDATPGAEQIGTPLAGATSLSELNQLFASIDGAVLRARTAPGGRVVVEGYVATLADLTRLQDAIGEGGNVVNRAQVAAAPFRDAIGTLVRHTDVAGGVSGGPSVRPYNHGLEYRQGESLVLAATASGHFDGYLYIDLVLPDGRVRHLYPGAGSPDAAVPSGQEVIVGAEDGSHEIAEPLGQLLAIVISTPQPLFEAPRPETESADAYFTALNAALESLGASGAASSYSFVTIMTEN